MKRLQELHDVNSDVEHLWPEPVVRQDEHGLSDQIAPTADQEIAELESLLDERKSALEKANRRIDRLIGEKTQLKALLEKRDRELQQLNRELGSHTFGRDGSNESVGGATSSWRSPMRLLGSIGERLRAFLASQPDITRDPNESTQSSFMDKTAQHKLSAAQHSGSTQGIVIILMVGLSENDIERLLPIVERDCRSRDMAPLCLVDIDAFELLRQRELVFEYLPSQDDRDRFDASLHWDLYVQRRLALIRRKWDPVRIVAFGTRAMHMLTLWSLSPFEDLPLPASSGETPIP